MPLQTVFVATRLGAIYAVYDSARRNICNRPTTVVTIITDYFVPLCK